MKTTIRMGSFETNSSSTHALVMTTIDEYRDWKNGNLYYSSDAGRFLTQSETEEYYKDCAEYRDGEWVALDENDWYARGIASSLNNEHAADGNYGRIYVEDEGELNGVAAVCFYIGN